MYTYSESNILHTKTYYYYFGNGLRVFLGCVLCRIVHVNEYIYVILVAFIYRHARATAIQLLKRKPRRIYLIWCLCLFHKPVYRMD